MAIASKRIVVLMTPREKRGLEMKARRLESSTAELVRRSVKAYEPDIDHAEIEALLRQFSDSHKSALAALERAERELAKTRAYFAAKSR